MIRSRSVQLLTCLILLAASGGVFCGCSSPPSDRPDLATVQGIVTMNGKPLADVCVTFIPEKGRPSIGISDADGRYQLTYIREIAGAAIGKHLVRITTVDRSEEGIPFKEIIPRRYREKTELTAEVTPGTNSIDFALSEK